MSRTGSRSWSKSSMRSKPSRVWTGKCIANKLSSIFVAYILGFAFMSPRHGWPSWHSADISWHSWVLPHIHCKYYTYGSVCGSFLLENYEIFGQELKWKCTGNNLDNKVSWALRLWLKALLIIALWQLIANNVKLITPAPPPGPFAWLDACPVRIAHTPGVPLGKIIFRHEQHKLVCLLNYLCIHTCVGVATWWQGVGSRGQGEAECLCG